MTDIDFDELDRAVNSLMQKHDGKESAQPASAPDVTDSVQPTQSAISEAPTSDANLAPATNTPITPPASLSTSPATRRSAGRFMDVVHPSSDMMSNRPPQTRPSRVGVSLQPSVEVAEAKEPSLEEPTVINDEAQLSAIEESPIVPMTDMQALPEEEITDSTSATGEVTPEPEHSDQAQLDDSVASLMADELREAQAPLESPFVQGAVVDKRPLGGTASDEPQIQEPVDQPASPDISSIDSVSATDVELSQEQDVWGQEQSEDQAVAEPLAPELDKDLMALESSDPSVAEEPVATEANPSFLSSHPVAPVAGDIPQQYTADLDNEPEPAPMYDATTSSPELTHKEKKKSGWLTVFLIILLLVIGAGGGAVVWYFLL